MRIRTAEINGPTDIRTDKRIGQQHIGSAGRDQHFGFGEGRALVTRDPAADLKRGDFTNFVGFAVRSQPLRTPGDAEHLVQIRLELVQEHKHRGGDKLTGVVQRVLTVQIHSTCWRYLTFHWPPW